MYMTHQFAHRETLERACNWLSKLGFDSSRMEIHDEGALRLTFWGAVGEGMAVQSILNAIESSDPDGHPSVWDLAQRPFTPAAPRAAETVTEATVSAPPSPIGWHPLDVSSRIDADLLILRDAMGH